MRWLKEAIVPGIMVIFGAVYYHQTSGFPEDSVLFSRFLMVTMTIAGVFLLVGEYRRARADPESAGAGKGSAVDPTAGRSLLEALKRPAILLAASTVYLVLFALTSFLVATIAFLAATMVVFKVHWLKAALIAVAFTVSLYVVFGVIFSVPV